MRKTLLLSLLCVYFASCHRVPSQIEPTIQAPPHPKEIYREKRGYLSLPENFSCSPFPSLSNEEACTDWGKEYRIALSFADDFDLYRAVTGFKRALFLLPPECVDRRLEIEYLVALSYYLGHKYVEAIYSVESTELSASDETFPAYSDLLLILYDSYCQVGKESHAEHILTLIEKRNSVCATQLNLLNSIRDADFDALCETGHQNVVLGYQKNAKSVKRAQIYNALLPGAGYWYVGLKDTAVTAFVVNSLFIAAATQFFLNGNTAAGIVTASLEGGWYFGGIYGAGLSAKYYNEQLYCDYASKITQREQLFPVLMLKYTF